mgnify:CR=1 FL=1|jgi:hypothetical protein
MIVCGAGTTVLGLSLSKDDAALSTLFRVNLTPAPMLDVDQATACSMIVWKKENDKNIKNLKNLKNIKNSKKTNPLMTVQQIECDDSTGMVVCCTKNGKVIKLSMAIEGGPLKTIYGDLHINSNASIGRKKSLINTHNKEATNLPDAWCTLICDTVAAKQLSFMSTTAVDATATTTPSDQKYATSTSISNLNEWSTFISCNGMGYRDATDVTVCVGKYSSSERERCIRVYG